METLLPVFTFLTGALIGGGAVFMLLRRQHAHQTATSQLLEERMQQQMKDTFEALAAGALQANSQHLMQLAQSTLGQHTATAAQQLDGKQQVITSTLTELRAQMQQQLTVVTEKLNLYEKERHSQFSTLGQQLQATHEHLTQLRTTTTDLKSALSNSRVRGQWGERMADDVLRLAGLQEHVSFRKQVTLTGAEGGKARPDLTFLLPGHRVIHMDVKFPLDHYLAWLEAPSVMEKDAAISAFRRAARTRIKEAATRDYRNASTAKGEEALDYVLVFIPNEQVYAFLLEHDPDLLGEAIRQHVILCSPTTLLAVLAVIRQAMENFSLERRTAEVQTLISQFQVQWQKFLDAHDSLGEHIHKLQNQFNTVLGTRKNMLERPLAKLALHMPEEADPTGTTPKLLNTLAADDRPN